MYRVCPKCGALASYNSYFASYICSGCSWHDSSPAEERRRKYMELLEWHRKICKAVRNRSPKDVISMG